MLRKSVILFLFCLPLLLGAQQQKFPFPLDSAEWGVVTTEYVYNWPNDYTVFHYSSIYLDGDTIIDGTNCKKLTEVSSASMAQYSGALRADSNGSIYLIHPNYLLEKPLYNFNLAVGDTFETYLGSWIYVLTVLKIDSTYIHNQYRKTLHLGKLGSNYIEHVWVEGIGSLQGLLYTEIPQQHFTAKLKCFRQKGQLIYGESCTLGQNERSISLKAYPNPATNELKVQFSSPGNHTYRLYTSAGVLLQQDVLMNNLINVSQLSPGFYILTIAGEQQNYRLTFVKQ